MKRGEGRWCKLPAESVAMAKMAAPVKVVARITPVYLQTWLVVSKA